MKQRRRRKREYMVIDPRRQAIEKPVKVVGSRKQLDQL
jgi:hypothetical protein